LTNDFAGKTDAQIATTVLKNLSLNTVAGLDNWVAAQLTAAGSTAAAKGAKLVSMLNDYAMMTADATYGASATSFNSKVAASLVLSQTTGNAGGSFAIASGDYSFVHGYNSQATGTTTIVLGDNITGSTENTVYVPDLVIKKLASIPANSAAVIGENGSVTWDNNYFYWKANNQWLRLSGLTF